MSRTFESLRVPNYRRFFLGQVISWTGTWVQWIAQGWLVLQLTGSGLGLGLFTALQWLPVLVFGAWAGVLADRTDRRRLGGVELRQHLLAVGALLDQQPAQGRAAGRVLPPLHCPGAGGSVKRTVEPAVTCGHNRGAPPRQTRAFAEAARVLERGLSNYWGYNTLSYFAPQATYDATSNTLRRRCGTPVNLESTTRYAQRKPSLVSGIERTRVPVAA